MSGRKQVRRFVLATVVALLALALGSTTASAASGGKGATCEPGPLEQAFAGFGDQNWYYLAPGGDFEGELSWARTGIAGLVPVGELHNAQINQRIDLGGLAGGLGDLVGGLTGIGGNSESSGGLIAALQDLVEDALQDLRDTPDALAATLGETSLALFKGGRVTTPKLCVTSATPHLRFLALASRESGQLDVEIRLYDRRGRVTDSSSGSISPSDHRSLRPTRFVKLKTDDLRPGETAYIDMRIRSQGEWLLDNVYIDPYRKG